MTYRLEDVQRNRDEIFEEKSVIKTQKKNWFSIYNNKLTK